MLGDVQQQQRAVPRGKIKGPAPAVVKSTRAEVNKERRPGAPQAAHWHAHGLEEQSPSLLLCRLALRRGHVLGGEERKQGRGGSDAAHPFPNT